MQMRAVVLSFVVLAPACLDEDMPLNPSTIADQSGAVFGWECDADLRCRLKRLDESPPAPVDDCGPVLKPTFSYSWGYMIELSAVCADDEGWVSLPGWGRFVVCEADADCPTIEDDSFVCNAGFCKNADLEKYFDQLPERFTMEQICLGDLPRYEPYEPSPELAAALDEACPGNRDDPCVSVPAGCRDPRG